MTNIAKYHQEKVFYKILLMLYWQTCEKHGSVNIILKKVNLGRFLPRHNITKITL